MPSSSSTPPPPRYNVYGNHHKYDRKYERQPGAPVRSSADMTFYDDSKRTPPAIEVLPPRPTEARRQSRRFNAHARRNGGRREPEAHLLSLVFPLIAGVTGTIVFGYAGENILTVPSITVLVGIFFIGFGFLTANALFAVYLVEAYPAYAGPVLVNVSSFRLIVGFIMSFKATQWIQDIGFLRSFGIYGGALALSCLGLPFVYFYGKRIRAWTAGTLAPSQPLDEQRPGA
ncbi:hypothetical protein MAPG_02002 [Magnaporthiopsis poae ATCC 64411]|uniref:Major facilitator superfamily (MFS) profile domain-containing protein n=1 Tax=Magnaporthiopsis poae (strain ATCC 64411 / 73-15) TaxID=644358 RepID=A0A0C4DQ64_MAGP6|nr:hypothetical protein MAPG_02002 [Magnaporthiopsis poae ATCC 64411]